MVALFNGTGYIRRMIATTTLLGFLTTCLIIEVTPGPNMAYLTLLSIGTGRRAGFATVGGIALGLLIIGIAAALGVAALIAASPAVYELLRLSGVIYLLWLAWCSWHENTETSPGRAEDKHSNLRFFRRGLIVNILNPKAAVFYIAVLPQFTLTTDDIVRQTLTLTAIYVMIATLVHLLIVWLASSLRPMLEDPYRHRIARRILSLSLVMIAFWFAWETVQRP